jgi:23S rRNA (uracil1939-C5)-methyltransferase
MPYDMQLKAKAEILREQLQRIGKIQAPPVQPTVAPEDPWNYRNHVQFHLDEHGRLGFQAAGSDQVVPISECHLPAAALGALWPQLKLEADSGVARLALRAGTHDELMLVLEAESPETPELEIEADVSVAHRYQDQTVILEGSDHISMEVLGRSFRVSPASFFQVNTDMAGRMVQHVLRRLPEALAAALDVYCGVGLFSAFLAPRCKRLIGIESSASACADFMVNLDEFSNVELYEDLAEHALPALSVEPELVLVDPPRAGLTAVALDAIAQMHPSRIAYVSCDPSTLARDARRLIDAGLRLTDVTPFDLFPQTYHIESISFFES